jgi:RNA polymerase sigma-70 factor (ECF subfamily)
MSLMDAPREEKHSSISRSEPVEHIETMNRAHASPANGLSESDFSLFYEKHASEVLRYANRCLGRREIAEEVASEAFLTLYRNRGRVEPATAIAWLMTVVKNLATDYWRRQGLERRHQQENPVREPVSSPVLEDFLLDHPSLKAEHRVCLTLRYVHGMERREIAQHAGMTENQVKSCLQYGLELLRKALDDKPK